MGKHQWSAISLASLCAYKKIVFHPDNLLGASVHTKTPEMMMLDALNAKPLAKTRYGQTLIYHLYIECVAGALAGYFGHSARRSKGTLKRRTRSMLRFGQGARVAHWRGRLILQHEDSDRLVVCRQPVTQRDPTDAESALVRSFQSLHGGSPPFANMRD